MNKLIIALLFTLFSSVTVALDRAKIADTAENVTPLLNGQVVPNSTLQTADGAVVSLKALLMQKPSVLIFYRGGWCPYCSQQLAELKDIEQDLVSLGYQVLAISPESPEKLQQQKLETDFAVQLLSDQSLQAIRGFGIGFYTGKKLRNRYKTKMGIQLTEDQSGKAVLPAPAVFITNQTGEIQFSYVNPNFRVRPSAKLVLEAARLSL